MKKFITIFILLFLFSCAHNGIKNHLADDFYDPVSETDEYWVYSFHVSESIDTTVMEIIIPDTIQISWNQPKIRRDFDLQPIPGFHENDDTILSIIFNDSSLYRYIYTGNDTSVFISGVIEGLYTGYWEFSVMTVDTAGLQSQLSEPCLRYIRRTGVPPLAPVDVWIILK